ncbi:type II toxin-antitoxin system VapC family toxin [Gracilimonas mengyeensis]|uniref:PIN domain nuclease, a component of toxin-antitoxin system (PIN domain) n=1 Tax=Gracilimonas mengyeensis TaxID=1302730 RepID=A0A521CIR5_9BACT|nr:type II toxin-antitoxin system VapC family toxin [Gracilimonas mengyeensis]SMO59337.1 PIN domain nuclease, a component of toxin-antitoxin system (PIN domain) [Gracilimonas mengyeensis]
MNFLLDTHTLIWSILDTHKLSSKSHKIIEDPKNLILVSAVNFWEISLKYSLGKLVLDGIKPDDFPKLAVDSGFELIGLTANETSSYHYLRGEWHRDPFDRMLIWQAIQRDLILISNDEDVKKYEEEGLKTIW